MLTSSDQNSNECHSIYTNTLFMNGYRIWQYWQQQQKKKKKIEPRWRFKACVFQINTFTLITTTTNIHKQTWRRMPSIVERPTPQQKNSAQTIWLDQNNSLTHTHTHTQYMYILCERSLCVIQELHFVFFSSSSS